MLAACSYTPVSGQPEGDAMQSGDDASQPPPDGPNTSVAPCSAPDPTGLVLCLEIEDDVADGTLLDSSPRQHDAAAQNLSAATRTIPAMSPAAEIGPTTEIRIPESADFDRDAAYTIAMWIRPNTLPDLGTVYGLMDHEQQFAVLIGRSGVDGSLQNRCVHTGVARFEFTEQLPEDAWSFLACTWDGVDFCASRWSADGDTERFCHKPLLLPSTAGTQGLAIGHLSENGAPHSRFDGAIDSVQLYDRGMTADQLCTMIGKPAGCLPCTICE
jgi:hypothetical protein